MTPSSSEASSVSRSEKTWKPPESVRIGPSHAMNACRPPSSAISVLARPEVQVVRVAEDDRRAERAQLVGVDALDRRLRADGHERGRRRRRRARCAGRRRARAVGCGEREDAHAASNQSWIARGELGVALRARAAGASSCSRMRASSAASASRGARLAEQRRDPRQMRLVLVEDRRELALAAVAPEVPPLGRAPRRHRISIASPKE